MEKVLFIFLFSCLSLQVQPQESRLTLLFAGDAMQHLPQVHGARNADGTFSYDSCFYWVRERIGAADLAGVNFETTLSDPPYTGYPLFGSPDAFAQSLQDIGFDLFFQANNHSLDKGRKGLERTIDILDSLHIKHTGTFKTAADRSLHYPLMIIKNGFRIAFLNYTVHTNGLNVQTPNIINLTDTNRIRQDLQHTRLYKPDVIIAQMHWGEEYQTTPSREQRKLANLLLREGVRIIIGHHPHVVQPIEIGRNAEEISHIVYYSLGNFVSNQQQPETEGGMLAEIVLSKKTPTSPAVIETCDHTFVWVQKRRQNNKSQHRLVPSWSQEKPPMNEEEKQKMDIFVRQAKKIVLQKL